MKNPNWNHMLTGMETKTHLSLLWKIKKEIHLIHKSSFLNLTASTTSCKHYKTKRGQL